ncbi:MAG: GAF domain-containing protein [Chloroflexota bacterium]|nr:MAG: GAF domain-containing protein [Chloroflexota bacterium]
MEPLFSEVLARLNEIGATINRIGSGDQSNVARGLNLIVESAIKVVPGASAVIYTYDEGLHAFDPASRVSIGETTAPVPGDEPRPNGMGTRAVSQKRRVISYEEPDLDIHPIKVNAGARTVACFPLMVAERALGALYVYLHDDRSFSQLELLMLENFVNQAAMAIYQARQMDAVKSELRRKENELVRLRRAGLLISSRLRLEETLETILQMALEVTNARYGIFRLMDRGGHNLITRAIAGEHLTRPLVEALPIDSKSVMGWVAEHRQPVRISDLLAEPWVSIYYPLDSNLQMRSELAVPLIGASGRLEGVLNLESTQINAFSEEDSHLLQALATQAVTAIQEARLLDALQEVAQLLLVQPCQQVLNRLVDLACDLLNAAASTIWTIRGSNLVLQACTTGYPREPSIPLQGSLTGQAVATCQPVTADDVRTDPRFHRPDLARIHGWTRALIVPLLAGDDCDPIGALSVYSAGTDPGRFADSEWDKKVLTCLAHYATLAVQNAARMEALRSAQEQRSVAETFAAIGDIAANLLHKLNNKVGTIPVRVEGIMDKCGPALEADPYLAKNLAEIERSASEAMASVQESLSHLHPIHKAPVSIASCVSASITAAALPEGVRVQSEGLESLPIVVAGMHSLTLVFTNLLENAADAMSGEGTVTIRGTSSASWVEITLSDTGPGIAPELHDRIFELSYSSVASTRPGKLGFGLWWVKTAMARLGGSVSVESDGEHGTTFLLRLPREEQP